MDELQKMNSWATGGRAPDVIVLLDLPVADARQRLSSSRLDRIEAEGEEFLDRAQAGFRHLAAADPLRWRVVDAAGSVEEVAERVWKAVDEARKRAPGPGRRAEPQGLAGEEELTPTEPRVADEEAMAKSGLAKSRCWPNQGWPNQGWPVSWAKT